MEVLLGLVGIAGLILGLVLFISVVCLPFFVWGIYNSSKRQENLLKRLVFQAEK